MLNTQSSACRLSVLVVHDNIDNVRVCSVCYCNMQTTIKEREKKYQMENLLIYAMGENIEKEVCRWWMIGEEMMEKVVSSRSHLSNEQKRI